MFKIPNYSPNDPVNRFEFEAPRRHWWQLRRKFSIPMLHYVPLDIMRKARGVDKPLQLQEIAKLIGEPAAARAIARLNQPEINALERAWMEATRVSLGELAASST
jgi:hypothetical protein